jgi:ketosteroid isomerase-like protein
MNKVITLRSIFTIGLLLVFSLFAKEQTWKEVQHITADQNKQLVLRLFNEVLNQKSLHVIDEIYTQNMTDHSAFPDQVPGVDGIKSAINGFFESFDNIKITVEDVIVEEDKVVTREFWRVTHKASGKVAEGTVIHIFRVHDNRITDEWSRGWDWLEAL